MPLLIGIILFLDLAVIIFYAAYLIFRKPTPALQRLAHENRPAAEMDEALEGANPVAGKVARLLKPLGEAFPKSSREAGQTRKKLFRAGYRGRAAVAIYYGLMVLMALLLPVLLYIAFSIIGDLPQRQQIPVLFISLFVGYLLPGIVLQARIKRRQEAIRRALPDALDLMVVCVEAGLGLDQTIMRVSEELHRISPEISEEFGLVNLEMRAGKPRVDALRNLVAHTGVDDVSTLVAMLIQTDRFGTSIAQSLRIHSDAMRVKRRQRAEEMASKVPVKLVFPIFFFIFPAIFVVTLGPAVLEIITKFLPSMR
ncbi:MAG: type II secretion system F family protein [Acidobacteria bacterium]|nr:type II secretion system F family protein [Acidobacteriota bacterium]MBI3657969.1 type II secretion system F family protein [Acidobacteriota bacterium]